MATKPASKPDWNPPATVVTEPSALKKAAGWSPGEKPFATHFNWLFQNISQWLDYVDTFSDDFTTLDAALAAEIQRAEAAEAALAAEIANIGVASGTVLPTPAVGLRGQLFLLLGDVGAPDTLYICAKDYLDNYNWFEVILMNT